MGSVRNPELSGVVTIVIAEAGLFAGALVLICAYLPPAATLIGSEPWWVCAYEHHEIRVVRAMLASTVYSGIRC